MTLSTHINIYERFLWVKWHNMSVIYTFSERKNIFFNICYFDVILVYTELWGINEKLLS